MSRIKNFDTNLLAIVIEFDVSPVPFVNGTIKNKSGKNQKAAAIFAYGVKKGLTKEEILKLFGGFYQAVLNYPNKLDHPNIRQFMLTGIGGLKFPEGWGIKERKVPLFSPPVEKPDKKKTKKKK